MEKSSLLKTDTLLDEHGDYLFRYALMRVKDVALAEDVVQETLVAALAAKDSFAAIASVRTWLVTILKHKMIDHWRRQGREVALSDLLDDAGNEAGVDEFFNQAGRWVDMPNVYPDPDAALENKQFWKAFEHCLSRLKPQQAEVFIAREVHGVSNEEICKSYALSASNAWVLLYRARVALGKCLELHWLR